MAADAAELSGLEMPIPDEATQKILRSSLPDTASVGNPVDVIGDADPDRYLAAFETMQASDQTDAIVVIATPQNMTQPTELARRLAEAHDGSKPLLTAFLGGDEVAEARKLLTSLGVPNYPSPERALGALKAMADYSAWRSRPPRVVTHYPVNRRRVDRLLRWHHRMGLQQVGEVEAKQVLRAYDFRMPEGRLVESADQAIETAERIGYPVVLKIVSPDIIHKSDAGGVRLNLASADQVRDAYDLLMLRAGRRMPDARIRGALIEKMGRRGREVILGMTRDPQFGPMLMFGLGGIFVEVMKDVTFHLAPITSEEAMQMLQGTRSYALLKGARGESPVDLDAIAAGLQRISQLSTDYPEIIELDINPYIVSGVGGGAYVADARMSLASSPKTHE
jgi:acetyltransferase